MRAKDWMLALWVVSGCLSSSGGHASGSGEDTDGGAGTGGDDGGAGTGGDASDVPTDCAAATDVCACESTLQADLLRRAAEAGCARDADCVLLGSCDQGFGFVAVPQSFRAETQALIEATACDWFDGPSYDAVCEVGSCVARENGGACGAADAPLCELGQALYVNACVAAPGVEAEIRPGCFARCDPEAAQSTCAAGFSCRVANVCSVNGGFQAEGCTQCEGIAQPLCIPDVTE